MRILQKVTLLGLRSLLIVSFMYCFMYYFLFINVMLYECIFSIIVASG